MFGLGKRSTDTIDQILNDMIYPVGSNGIGADGRLHLDFEKGDDRCLLRAAQLSCSGVGQSSGALSQDELVLGLASFAAWMGQGVFIQRSNSGMFQNYARNYRSSSVSCSLLLVSRIASESSVLKAVTGRVPSFDYSNEVRLDAATVRVKPDSLSNGITIVCGQLAADFMHHAWGEGVSAIGSILERLPVMRHYRGTHKAVETRFGTEAADYLVSSNIGDALAGYGPAFKDFPSFKW